MTLLIHGHGAQGPGAGQMAGWLAMGHGPRTHGAHGAYGAMPMGPMGRLNLFSEGQTFFQTAKHFFQMAKHFFRRLNIFQTAKHFSDG